MGLALSGVDRPEDEIRVREWVDSLGISTVRVSSDAVAAVAAGTAGILRSAVAVISGTGCIVYGFDAHGKQRRAAGWGYSLLAGTVTADQCWETWDRDIGWVNSSWRR